MTDLVQQLEHMRVRMNQQAQQEANLVAELSDALRATDHQLLQDVRTLTAEHDARRATILCELQLLAARLNALPLHEQDAGALASGSRGMLSNAVPGSGPAAGRSGDWEQRSAHLREALATHLLQRRALAG